MGGWHTAGGLDERLACRKVGGRHDHVEEAEEEESCDFEAGEEGGLSCAGMVDDQPLRECCAHSEDKHLSATVFSQAMIDMPCHAHQPSLQPVVRPQQQAGSPLPELSVTNSSRKWSFQPSMSSSGRQKLNWAVMVRWCEEDWMLTKTAAIPGMHLLLFLHSSGIVWRCRIAPIGLSRRVVLT